MPRYRNPRYAPESLERRLHPDAALGTAAATILVSNMTTLTLDPADEGGMPPTPTPPPPPTGPSGPAITIAVPPPLTTV